MDSFRSRLTSGFRNKTGGGNPARSARATKRKRNEMVTQTKRPLPGRLGLARAMLAVLESLPDETAEELARIQRSARSAREQEEPQR